MKKALLIILIFLVVQGVLSFVLSMVCMLFLNMQNTQIQGVPAYYWCLGASLILSDLLIIVCVYYVLRKDCKRPYLSYMTSSCGRDFMLSFVTFLALMFFINGITELINVPDILKNQFDGMTRNWLCIVGITLVGPITEEFCFRRGVLGCLLASPKFHRYALFLSAFIFALIHLNPAQMGGAFLLGLFFGWLYIRTHSLVLPLVFHVLNNSISVVLGFIFGNDAKIIDNFPNTTSFYIALFVSAVVALLLFRLMQKKMNASYSDEDKVLK
ncbi:MAG: type II CAAX endopeptidase family protein [Bacteroidaceae bacterium]|nr:type II CAAX endopeptidase family protein [Bacteroidaceae bacterium]